MIVQCIMTDYLNVGFVDISASKLVLELGM